MCAWPLHSQGTPPHLVGSAFVSVSCTRMLGFSQHSAGAQSAAEQPPYQAVQIVVWTGLEVSRMLVALSVRHAVTP